MCGYSSVKTGEWTLRKLGSPRARSAVGLVSVEVRHELFHTPQIPAQCRGRVAGSDGTFAANMLDDMMKRRRIKARASPDGVDDGDVVLRRDFAVQAQECAEDDHDRAQARDEKLELALALISAGENALAEPDQLAHRLLLELETQMFEVDANSVERRIAEQDSMSLEDVGVFHREDVR